ncbi:MAG TPA: hypothetical protein VNE41_06035 [Chitinophagaceae bacterium]|nr:hypothetical protein [Chitinophagaceae bacterium]
MKKIIIAGLLVGGVFLFLHILGLYLIRFTLPGIAVQYFDPAFDAQSDRFVFYCIHPFVLSMSLSWFWSRLKGVLAGSFLTRGIEFGLIYVMVATFPMLWLIYSSMSVSLLIVSTWLILALVEAVVAGLILEYMNP